MKMYPGPLSLPLTFDKHPVPLASMHPHNIIPPPPCFNVGWTQYFLRSSPTILLTKWLLTIVVLSNFCRFLQIEVVLCYGGRLNVVFSWFATIQPSFSWSPSCGGNRDMHCMLVLHLGFNLWGGFKAVNFTFLHQDVVSRCVVFLFLPGILRSLTLPVSCFFFSMSLALLWLQPTLPAICRCV